MLLVVSSFKGPVVDLEDGNLVKLAEDGTVLRYALTAWSVLSCFLKNAFLFVKVAQVFKGLLKWNNKVFFCIFFFSVLIRATHGTNDLSTEEIIKHYGPKREWKHFNSLNTSLSRSGIISMVMFVYMNPGFCFHKTDLLFWSSQQNTISMTTTLTYQGPYSVEKLWTCCGR